MRRLLFPLALVFPLAPVQAAGLNDTGQTQCVNADGTALVTCSAANTGDAAPYPRQDARFGRDAAAAAGMLTKTGGGAAGFDFTKICNSGQTAGTGDCPSNPTLGSGANDWACTRDNVSGLVWEVKTDNATPDLRDKDWTYTWYNGSVGVQDGTDNCFDTARCDTQKFVADVNTAQLCGHSDWRLPASRELLSIVHLGAQFPAIDATYFPNTFLTWDWDRSWYWSSDLYMINTALAWSVRFAEGSTSPFGHDAGRAVRLVRGGQ